MACGVEGDRFTEIGSGAGLEHPLRNIAVAASVAAQKERTRDIVFTSEFLEQE